ncbi:MAG: IS66 family transposase, partial [Actinobacteria bacterium]|nr:IS66 family transposase [Actinomycetota bacterium]
MPEAPSYEQLLALVGGLSDRVVEQDRVIAQQADRIAELQRRLGLDSSNSSRPPSSDAPWDKTRAKKRSSRTRSGRNPGKQPGAEGSSRSLVEDPNRVVVISPKRCGGCAQSLAEAAESGRERRQVVDVAPAPAPEITEYQRVSKVCTCCGAVSTPGWDETGDECAEVVGAPGSPVRIGPQALARAALLTCGHHLPVGRSRTLLEALTGIDVSTGLLAGVRGRAARKLEKTFLPYLRELLGGAPVLHADETTGRAAGSLSYVHVAATQYLTLMHVGGRSAADIDAGGVLPEFTGILVRDGYSGYAHLPAVHAWCGAHLLRDLRSISDADPDGQLWALAMADTLIEAHHGANQARARGAEALDDAVPARIRNHYHGALARGRADNQDQPGTLAAQARTLITRFTRFEDMILRFATDLVPFTNNEAER